MDTDDQIINDERQLDDAKEMEQEMAEQRLKETGEIEYD